MEASPLVSVIIPCFNVAPYLVDAIESIRDQTVSNIEIVCVDDGSTDGTREILASLAEQDSRIRLMLEEHGGIAHARNRGLAYARAEIVANLDSDDLSLPTRLERQLEYFDLHAECVALGTQALQITAAGEPLGPLSTRLRHEEIEDELMRGRGFALIHTSAMFRKSAILAVGGYDEQLPFAVDLDLYLKLAEIGRLANLGETLVQQRRHVQSTTAINNQRRGVQIKRQVLEGVYRRRGLPVESISLWPMNYANSSAEVHASQVVLAVRNGYYRTATSCLGRMNRALILERRGVWRSWIRLITGLSAHGLRCLRAALVGSKRVQGAGLGQHAGDQP